MDAVSTFICWFDRQRMAFFVAFLAFVPGASSPWYALPPEAVATFDIDLGWLAIGQWWCVVLLMSCLVLIIKLSSLIIFRVLFWSNLVFILFLPLVFMYFNNAATLVATDYHFQQLRIQQHLENNFPEVQAQWKQNITLSMAQPIPSIEPLTIVDSHFFQLSNWEQWLEGSGYSNPFFEFIGRGFVFGLIGTSVGIIALYLPSHNQRADDRRYNRFRLDLSLCLVALTLAFLGASGFVLSFSWLDHGIDIMLARGEYQRVLNRSRLVSVVYPFAWQDTHFLTRAAAAGLYESQPDKVLLAFAYGVESYSQKRLDAAYLHFQQALGSQPNCYLCREYLAATTLNLGVNAFNSHHPSTAIEYFESTLQIFPQHLQALYYLMLAKAINHDFEASSLVGEAIMEVLPYFQLPSVALAGQVYLHRSWAYYEAGHLDMAWEEYRKSVDKRFWE